MSPNLALEAAVALSRAPNAFASCVDSRSQREYLSFYKWWLGISMRLAKQHV